MRLVASKFCAGLFNETPACRPVVAFSIVTIAVDGYCCAVKTLSFLSRAESEVLDRPNHHAGKLPRLTKTICVW